MHCDHNRGQDFEREILRKKKEEMTQKERAVTRRSQILISLRESDTALNSFKMRAHTHTRSLDLSFESAVAGQTQ